MCVRNPDGVFVEVMEDDPLAAAPSSMRGRTAGVAARSVTLSVPDLRADRALLRSGRSALRGVDGGAAAPEHEALWGLAGAHHSQSVVLDAGDVLVELVQYLDPLGKPWPEGHRISDQGILNIAFGYRRMREMMDSYTVAAAAAAPVPMAFRCTPSTGASCT